MIHLLTVKVDRIFLRNLFMQSRDDISILIFLKLFEIDSTPNNGILDIFRIRQRIITQSFRDTDYSYLYILRHKSDPRAILSAR